MTVRFIAVICTSVYLASCTPRYVVPATQSKATLQFFVQEGFGRAQNLVFFEDEACSKELGRLGGKLVEDTQKKVVSDIGAERQIFVRAQTMNVTSVGGQLGQAWCSNVISFVPQSGATYNMRHEADTSACYVSLIDQRTLAPPPTFFIHPRRDSCRP